MKTPKQYNFGKLSKTDCPSKPLVLFDKWLSYAIEDNLSDANAMVVSSVSIDQRVSSRIVLLKNYDETGFYFFSNYGSKKASDFENNNHVSLLFFWSEHERQIRIEGKVYKTSSQISDNYFSQRGIESQRSAIISKQSSVISNRNYLEEKMIHHQKKHTNALKRPEYWGGYYVEADLYEFWQGRANRLNDRIRYRKKAFKWEIDRLAP
ncbi:MAG: pyridoxamine 5'-phosphate oxidase [Marinifilaceae bacterium]|jgi:pyridoxamine 5'-phosphate oxidase|nr:pyridoxamine 5'-phosphate oxidase [Marinifilaceae bacterium]